MRRALLVMLLIGCGGAEKGGAPAPAVGGTVDDRITDEGRPSEPSLTPLATPTPGPNAGNAGALPAPGPNPTPGPNATPTPNGGAGLTPSAGAGSVVVIAKITDAGPIGDGKCSQRSYELAVAKTVSGSVPPKLWAHFEQCGARTSEPAAGNIAGTGLQTGTTYQLTLKKLAGSNFGDGFMIVDARTP
jgi:hypothetical protein